jgi:exodeoxyribonuclease V gamma subunit
MFVYQSNRAERLVDELARVVSDARDPFARETVVVQSKGMERWVAMELSRRLSIWANAEFPFPRQLVERVATAALGSEGDAGLFAPGVLTWAVAARLPELLERPAFAPLARYLQDDDDGTLRVQLAERIAGAFDDYLIYRPEWVRDWERGGDAGAEGSWEPELFRALLPDADADAPAHPAARIDAVLRALSGEDVQLEGFPERVSLFGIAALPPVYMKLLAALSRHVEVHLFVLAPSRQYWGDARKPRAADLPQDVFEGHPLLASLGSLGREFQDVLIDSTAGVAVVDRELFDSPDGTTLLSTLQADMLDLRDRGGDDGPPRVAIEDGDRSLSIHACHGPMREVEVLHDQLDALLEDDTLQPEDIVVMTPDIEAYAPVIDAVFGQRGGRPPIPYSISHRRALARSEVNEAFSAVLDLVGSRMTASAVVDLLSADPVRERFGITPEELPLLHTWIRESGVRWGVDLEHRVREGQPPHGENTWRFGLERLMLGYAMQGRGRETFAGRLPYDDVEGGAAVLLGKLAALCEQLFSSAEALRALRPLSRWQRDLSELLESMLQVSPGAAHQAQEIRQSLRELAGAAEAAGFEDDVPLRCVRALLEGALDQRLPARGFLSGGVTFCQMVPMRSIPFRVVALLGMGDESFPRRERRVGFHRLDAPGARRRGDRSPRDDDRHIFLEALLSARETLLVTYVGHGIHDDRELPPSVVVGELLDAVGRGFSVHGRHDRDAIARRLVTHHRLHAFSPAYFGDGPLFSYASHLCDGARAMGRAEPPPAFLSGPVDATPEELELTLDELCRWVTHPVRSFFQRRLGLWLGEDDEVLDDREPIGLDPLQRHVLGRELVAMSMDGLGDEEMLALSRAAGRMPLGSVGEVDFGGLAPDVHALAAAVSRARAGERLAPLSVDLTLDGVRITGTLHGLYPGGQVVSTFSKRERPFELSHWVRHLVLGCMLERGGRPELSPRSVLLMRTGEAGQVAELHLAPAASPRALLSGLLQIVRLAQVEAVPFAHDASRAYAVRRGPFEADQDADAAQAARERALSRARSTFEASERGEMYDDYVGTCFVDFDALRAQRTCDGRDFEALAIEVFRPFFEHREDA